ncbi:hypothetical protein P692DRAFT_201805514 [Suillus brevipes Sb2]|nr:hypothetical protein P692DRAFT_201805514 [Suillus brevipes Sb2]
MMILEIVKYNRPTDCEVVDSWATATLNFNLMSNGTQSVGIFTIQNTDGKQGNKSTGRAATRLKAEKRAELMDVARCRRAGVGTRDAKSGKRESAETRKRGNAKARKRESAETRKRGNAKARKRESAETRKSVM